MMDYAVRNLNKHCIIVNQLNVFPVPDGDTGTNMVTTIRKGLQAVEDSLIDLSSVSRKFARSVVFEARGNSGVIVSQFLKGISEKFYNVNFVDGELLVEALEKGVDYAYSSVATPVEGTMLTVIKDATRADKNEVTENSSVDDVIGSFICHAKVSLENTPELLPVLKESGVVDSGGAGIVYLFEGMKKYLDGEALEEDAVSVQDAPSVNYDFFGRDSVFEFGYCTELLLQLLNAKESFDCEAFREELSLLGDSLVLSAEDDKVRVHIHTKNPEKVFALSHRYGEFLTCKIENMTVQHSDQEKRILCSDVKNDGAFSVVAVAGSADMQQLFVDMGADVAINAKNKVSTRDFLDAFEFVNTPHVFVFPNSSDAVLTALQAKELWKNGEVTVVKSKGIGECYAALPAIDFEETDPARVHSCIRDIIDNLDVVSVSKTKEPFSYGRLSIDKNEYYSYSGKELITISKNLKDTVLRTVDSVMKRTARDIITVFYHSTISDSQIEEIVDGMKENGISAEIYTVSVENLPCELTISLE